jgi:CubicO group peptidase (beta-lactamase class C family)
MAQADELPGATPEEVGLDSGKLVELTEWIRDNPLPIFSVLISRHGKLVYELYTSGIERERAHYLMSVTKSVVSALVGIALGERSPETSIVELLPGALFGDASNRERFRSVTVKDVLGMAALDAPDPPRVNTPEAVERLRAFIAAPNRVRFALTQALLLRGAFQYNDVGPAIAAGIVQYTAKKSSLAFADEKLFGPMGFRNQEWMHQDGDGLDGGGYGLRLRPIDMQKFGILYLQGGRWNGRQLVPRAWVERSFTPWNRSHPGAPDYGWFWWAVRFASGAVAHVANGWKGQRIAVFPDEGLVLTMTACIEDGHEEAFFAHIIDAFVHPATHAAPLPPAPEKRARLQRVLDEARAQKRVGSWIEPRMVPQVAPKEQRRPTRL